MTEQQAMRMAIEALETLAHYENPETKIQNRKKDGGSIVTIYPHKVASDAATALRQALEQQPTDEPVAWTESDWHYQLHKKGMVVAHKDKEDVLVGEPQPLYTRPQPAEWIGLRWSDTPDKWVGNVDFMEGAKWAEKTLKEKNT